MQTVSSYRDKYKFVQDGNWIWKNMIVSEALIVSDKVSEDTDLCFITTVGSQLLTDYSTNIDASTILITVSLFQVNSQFA